jgi:hypothetical protein
MKCAEHPEVEASGFCRNCGKAMCPACVRQIRDVLYCEDCVAQVMGIPAVQPAVPVAAPVGPVPGVPPVGTRKATGANPGAAFVLGFFPGIGAVYNGEYNKALIHIVIFGALILGITGAFGDSLTGFWIVALVAFIFYMAIDSLRTAKARRTGEPVQDPLEVWTKNRPIGPIILIGVGALFLLNNFGFFDFFRVRHIFWPLVLIGAGFLMLRNRMGGQS